VIVPIPNLFAASYSLNLPIPTPLEIICNSSRYHLILTPTFFTAKLAALSLNVYLFPYGFSERI